MRTTIALGIAVFLFGCAPMPSLEELEEQAAATGDWSAVEQREKLMSRRAEARRPQACPSGQVSYCEDSISSWRCACVSVAGLWR